MPLRIYNTLSRSLEDFEPLDPDLVRIYNCGPTVYGNMHIGHAKAYVSFDVIVRWLRHLYGGDGVLYVMNITDVGHLVGDADEGEDKIQAEARRASRSAFEVAAEYERTFWRDMESLNNAMPDRTPHASDFVRQQIEMTGRLIEKGVAYEANGSVYFDVEAYGEMEFDEGMIGYGGLSNRVIEDQTGGERIAENPEKKNPQDFALWKQAEPEHLMQWHSPWGWGFPGWHIECSVMSTFYLGDTFDIHGGGIENQFPHHECEIAQSQADTGKPFVRYWMHNNMVTTSGQKMGKSLGNAWDVADLLEEHSAMAIRFFILQSHYRSTLEFAPDSITAAGAGFERLENTMVRLREAIGTEESTDGAEEPSDVAEVRAAFTAAMNDDFNTPVALGALFDGVSTVNRLLSDGSANPDHLAAWNRLLGWAFEDVLGLQFEASDSGDSGLVPDLIDYLLELRADARAAKDFATADAIRDRLATIGVTVEDGKEGGRYRIGR